MKRNTLMICILSILVVCLGLAACHSGGGSGETIADMYLDPTPTATPEPTKTAAPTSTPTVTSAPTATPTPYPTPTPAPTATPTPSGDTITQTCFMQIGGTWMYSTDSDSGTLTLNSKGQVTAITMSTCPGATVSNPVTKVEGSLVYISYAVKCTGTTRYHDIIVSYVNGKCDMLSGDRGGDIPSESIIMKKQ